MYLLCMIVIGVCTMVLAEGEVLAQNVLPDSVADVESLESGSQEDETGTLNSSEEFNNLLEKVFDLVDYGGDYDSGEEYPYSTYDYSSEESDDSSKELNPKGKSTVNQKNAVSRKRSGCRRPCNRKINPVCARVNGRRVTILSLCEFWNMSRCHKGSNRKRPVLLHLGRCGSLNQGGGGSGANNGNGGNSQKKKKKKKIRIIVMRWEKK